MTQWMKDRPTLMIELIRQLVIGVTIFGIAALTEAQEGWILSFCSLLLMGVNQSVVTPMHKAEEKAGLMADAAHAQGVKDGVAQATSGVGV